MKKIALALLIIFGVAFIATASDKTKGKVKFQQTVYDFGNIREDGGKVTCEFVFINEGSEPVKIEDARAECGCTKPEFPKNEIAPGKSGVIKVTYNPLGRPGGFVKRVTVRSTGNPAKTILKIRGTVLPK